MKFIENVSNELHVFLLSAMDLLRLKGYAGKFCDFIEGVVSPRGMASSPGGDDYVEVCFADLIFTLQAGRVALPYRLAIVVSSPKELVGKLKGFCENGEDVEGVFQGDTKKVRQSLVDEGVIERFIDGKNMVELAKHWVWGAEIDWRSLYVNGKPKRVSLPTYPFAKERYWLSDLKPQGGGEMVLSVNEENLASNLGNVLIVRSFWKEEIFGENSFSLLEYAKHLVVFCDWDGANRGLCDALGENGIGSVYIGSQHSDLALKFQDCSEKLFEIIRDILADKSLGKVLVQVVVPYETKKQVLFALSGMLKTGGLENPRLVGQVILLDPKDMVEDIGVKLKYDGGKCEDHEILYRGGKRLIKRWAEVESSTLPNDGTMPWKGSGVYLITGGAGGLGLIFAQEIAGKVDDVTIILTGRSPFGDNIKAKLNGVNAKVEYKQVDVSQKEDVINLVSYIKEEFGGLNGIIHSAGVIKDCFIIKKDIKELKEVLGPKVAGVVNLDEATMDMELDFFVLFSSGAGVMGNPGQVDYAAANAFMDNYVQYRNMLVRSDSRKGKTLAINWPLWRDGGMKVDKNTEKMMEQVMGIVPLDTGKGIEAFYRAMAAEGDQVMVIEGDLDRIKEGFHVSEYGTDPLLPKSIDKVDLEEVILCKLKEILSELTLLDVKRIDGDEPLESYGLDSVMVSRFNQKLNAFFGELSKTLFYEYRTLNGLADYLIKEHEVVCMKWTNDDVSNSINNNIPVKPKNNIKQNIKSSKGEQNYDNAIAIIGLSGRYSQAGNVEEYWDNLISGRQSINEIPGERWDWKEYYHENAKEATVLGKSYSKWGAFLDDFAQFDPLFFNMTPKEGECIDPQERLFLEECWKAMEDAGYAPSKLSDHLRQRIGVFGGVTKEGFNLYSGGKDNLFLSTSFSSLVNRVSYNLNLQGPSVPVDAMCASSTMAIHQACEYIRSGKGDMAIAGGVNLYLHPYTYIGLSRGQIISSNKHSAAFEKGGTGFVPGEGVGVVILKVYDKAIEDRDGIYAIIRGTAVNHSGKTNGYTTSDPNRQAEVIKQALNVGNIDPRSISYIEAAANGSEMGDAIEMNALTKVFGEREGVEGEYKVGSVKPNIGHCESASAMSQLTKVVMSLKHGVLAETLLKGELNPNIDVNKLPFKINTQLSQWERVTVDGKKVPRRAGVTSVGAGGVNGHIILEEYVSGPVQEMMINEPVLFILSAKDKTQLKVYVELLISYLKKNIQNINLENVTYTLQTGREEMPCRLAIVTRSSEDLSSLLIKWNETEESVEGSYFGDIKNSNPSFRKKIDLSIKDLKELAKLWVEGNSLSFEKRYVGKELHKVTGLPTYPFKRRLCWFGKKQSENTNLVKNMEYENKAAEFYSFAAREAKEKFQEEYLTFAPFLEEVSGFSISEIYLDPQKFTQFSDLILAKQIEMRQVLFYKEDFNEINSLLDIGCGHGTDVIQIAKLYPHITTHGFTITEAQATLGNQRIADMKLNSSEIFYGDSSKGAFPTTYDVIIGIEVTFHIRDKDGLFFHIDEALREGGSMLLMDFTANLRGAIVDPNVEITISTVEDWVDVLSKHNLVIDEVVDVSPEVANFLHDPGFKKNLENEADVVKNTFQNYANQAISLRKGWISYCLFKLKKDSKLGESERFNINMERIENKTPYSGALREMLELDNIPYPLQKRKTGTLEKLLDIFVNVFSLNRKELEEAATLEDIGIDDVKFAEVMKRVNSQFNINLPTDSWSDFNDFESFANYIDSFNKEDESIEVCENRDIEVDKTRLEVLFENILGLERKDLEEGLSFKDLGIGSINAVELVEAINIDFNLRLPTSIMFQCNDFEQLASLITDHLKEGQTKELHARKPVRRKKSVKSVYKKIERGGSSDDIAIIGISCRSAGANGIDEFGKLVMSGKDCIKEINNSEWLSYFDSNLEKPMAIRYGAMEGVEYFDPLFFKISPKEAESMDPSHRILMEECYKALEDSGYKPSSLKGQKVGSIIGTMGSTSIAEEFSHFSMLGADTSIMVSRISHYLDLKGPALAINTACSSSLTAIDIACQKLESGEINMAIAGGITIYTHPGAFVSMNTAGMLSPTGDCRPFDNKANGIVVGDGVGVVILKRLSDAEMDNDYVYGVIRGNGTNQDGQTAGITVPSYLAQSELEESVYKENNINVEDIQYIEAHGTATKLGDPVEIHGLSHAYNKFTSKKRFCAIGSLKANIGHTTAASGVLGLIKILLSLKCKQIPPSINFDKENEHIDFDNSPVYVNSALKEWPLNSVGSRLAAVSSFGFSGTNAHFVVEEYKDKTQKSLELINSSNPGVLIVSAMSWENLQLYVKNICVFIKSQKNINLVDLMYTFQVGRESLPYRLALVVFNLDELVKGLEQFAKDQSKPIGGYVGEVHQKDALNLGDSDEGKEFIQKLVENRKIKKIIELWIKGCEIDWRGLYPEGSVNRLAGLPTYPFCRESYGAPTGVVNKVEVATSSPEDQMGDSKGGVLESASSFAEMMTFEEVWQEQVLENFSNPGIMNIVCFLSNKDKQQAFREVVGKFNGDINIIFISQEEEWDSLQTYYIPNKNLDSYNEAFRSIGASFKKIDVLLYLWPVEDASYVVDYNPIIFILQAIKAVGLKTKKLLLVGQFDNGLERSYLESWIGFERSLGLVMADTETAVIIHEADKERSVSEFKGLAEKLLSELNTINAKTVLYENGKRYVSVIRPGEIKEGNYPLKVGGTYLIIGGGGGLGLLFAKHLSEKHPVNLVLLGRSPLDDEKKIKMEALEDQGSSVIYIEANLCVEEDMVEGLRYVKERFGTINGVIHAAGVQGSDVIFEKGVKSFQNVVDPKIRGTLLLDQVLNQLDWVNSLDFICYFSSSSAILGDFGSCDYAVGNRFLDAYAVYHNHENSRGNLKGKAYVINWPLWREGGMGFSSDENTNFYLKSSGLEFLESEEGCAFFDKVIAQEKSNHFVLKGQPERVYRFLGLSVEEVKRQVPVAQPLLESRRPLHKKGLNLDKCIELDLKEPISMLLNISQEKIGLHTNLADFGFDSISLAEYATKLSTYFDLDITPTLFYSYSTLEKLSRYFVNEHGEFLQGFYGNGKNEKYLRGSDDVIFTIPSPGFKEKGDIVQTKTEPIAIIGMSGKFPKADTVEDLWENIKNGVNCITEIPADRWDLNDYYECNTKNPGKTNSKWGAFMTDVDRFDPLFFEIAPIDAISMDPAQRLFLEEAWRTFEDAGYMGKQIRGFSCGVFVGVEESMYGMLAGEAGQINSNQNATLAARIAYTLDLKGPNLAITAACSSGLVALHQACLSLRHGDCEMALVGGISLLVSPIVYSGMTQAQMLSPNGECNVFDQRANGLVPGEAVASILLKPLSKAIRDNDHIYGAIKGSGVNYDGKTNGITAPNPVRQTELIQNIYHKYDIVAKDVQYIMTHSVGSKLSDAMEIEALTNVFNHSKEKQPHYLGSIKPLIGHTFAASGIVSLITVLKAIKNQIIPGTCNYQNCNEYINFKKSSFIINNQNQKWISKNGQSRIGSVSTTGISGTNAHVVIEEFIAGGVEERNNTISIKNDNKQFLIILSAKSNDVLINYVGKFIKFLTNNESVSLANVAYTLQIGRDEMEKRVAIVVGGISELIEKLRMVLKGTESSGIYYGEDESYGNDLEDKKNMNVEVQKWISKQDFEQLARLWVAGVRINWEMLYKNHSSARRISLPTYPFRRKPYWFNRDIHQKSIVMDGEGHGQEVFHRAKEVMVTESDRGITKSSEVGYDLMINIKKKVVNIFKQSMLIEDCDFNEQRSFIELGLNSINGIQFIENIGDEFKIQLNPTVIYDYTTLADLSEYLFELISPGLFEQMNPVSFPTKEILRGSNGGIDQSIDQILENLTNNSLSTVDALGLLNNIGGNGNGQ